MSRRRDRWILPAVVLAALLAAGFFFWRARSHPPAAAAGGATRPPDAPATAAASPTPSVADQKARRKARRVDLDDALSEKNPGTRSAKFGRRLAEWFQEDPEGALAYLQKMPQRSEYTAGLLIVLGGISTTDPDRALGLAQTMAIRREDWILYNAIFDQLARTDVGRAVKFLSLVPAGEQRQNATRALAEEWMAHDSTAAWAWAQSLDDPAERAVALEAALEVLSATKPEKSATLARQFLTGDALARSLVTSLHRLTDRDPPAAARVVGQLPPGPTQTTAALGVARALAAKNPGAALAWLQTLPAGDIQKLGLDNVLDVWGAANPNAAKTYVSRLPAGPAQDAAAGHLALSLAATNPDLVFDWAAALPTESARNSALVSIASAWARNDPASATKWAGTFPSDSPIRLPAINGALSYWALQDAAAAGAFVPTLSDTEQPQAIVTVAPALAQRDPAAAIKWAQSLPNDDLRQLAVDAVVTRWSGDQPKDAAAWIMTQPESSQRVDDIRTVTENWFAADSKTALAWVQTLPPGPTRDGAIDAAAAHLTETNPALAAILAAMISSPALRDARTQQLRGFTR